MIKFCGKEINMLEPKIKELIAIGCSVACNCHPCVKYHTGKARELNVDAELVKQAIEVGKMVRKGAADEMDKLLLEISATPSDKTNSNCGCGK
jgi:AhpD family alkylhydroperoxidase